MLKCDIHKLSAFTLWTYNISLSWNLLLCDFEDISLAICVSWNLICDYALHWKVCLFFLVLMNEYITQCFTDGLLSIPYITHCLNIKYRYCVMCQEFVIPWYYSTYLNSRFCLNHRLNNTCIKLDSVIIYEITVCTSLAGQSSVIIYMNYIVGTDIWQSINLLCLKEYIIINLSETDGV